MSDEPLEPQIVRIDIPNDKVDQAIREAPQMYIDGALAYSVIGDMVRFNLFQDRLTYTGDGQSPMTRVICARLIMTKDVAKQFTDWLVKAQAGQEAQAAEAAAHASRQ